MKDNINWFILLPVNFICSRSSNVEMTSRGVEETGEGVNRLWLVPVVCHNTVRETENTNAGCCSGAIKQLSEKDNVL
jgi:hypothetical protein